MPGPLRTLAPYPDKTLVDYLREHASAAPSAIAVYFKGSRLTYAELDRLSDCFAAALVRMGVARGDRVALLLPNCPQFLIAEFGAWKAGATVLPLNPLYTTAELTPPLRAAGVRTVVTLTPFYQRIKDGQTDSGVERVIATSIKEYLPPVLRLLFTLFKEKKGGHRITLQPGDTWFRDLTSTGPSSRIADLPSARPDDHAVLLLSGGTTGTPKAVVGRHRDLVTAGLQLNYWLNPSGAPRQDIVLMPLPLFHVYACVGSQSHAIVSRTPAALVPNPRDLDDLLKTIEAVRPTLFIAVPALFIALLNHPRVAARKVDFSSIRASFSGAAPLMAATKERFEQLTGGRIIEGYSLTEAMMACIVNPLEGTNKIGSVGVALPDVEAAIVDAESGERFLARGETGEIVLRAPQIMTGYWHDAEETAKALRSHGAGAPWLHTGDLGYFDDDHYLFIVDRQKDLIKTSGYQVWPREVEEALALHPDVTEAGVAGIVDATRGEVVKAWVVRRAGSSVSVDDLRAHCRERLAPYKVPSQVEFRDSLPKTLTGKVLRRALVNPPD